jgi:hypothetical protein
VSTDKRHGGSVRPQSEAELDARGHHAERRADDNRVELREPRGEAK